MTDYGSGSYLRFKDIIFQERPLHHLIRATDQPFKEFNIQRQCKNYIVETNLKKKEKKTAKLAWKEVQHVFSFEFGKIK